MNIRIFSPTIQATLVSLLMLTQPVAFATDDSAQDSKKESAASEPATQKKVSIRAVELLETQMEEPINRRVPKSLRSQAKCIAVFPQVFKAGILVAVQTGQGLVSCRHRDTAKWMTPAYFDINAASVGLQVGIQSASIILLFLTDESVAALMNPTMTFDAGIDLAAGPVGAIARVENQPAVVSYVRTKGLFAGVDLSGGRLAYNKTATAKIYGAEVNVKTALTSNRAAPSEELQLFMKSLMKYAPVL